MRQQNQHRLYGRSSYQILCDEAKEPGSPVNAASILFVIGAAHLALRQKDWGNTPRQRKMHTKYSNRFKTSINVTEHVYRIFGREPYRGY